MKNKPKNTTLPKTESLQQSFPSCLDQIIQIRRDECSLRMSTSEELNALHPIVSMLDDFKNIRATIIEWRIVCLTICERKSHILVGINKTTNNAWVTSALKSVDFKNNLVLTYNSIYRLGSKGEGEPDLSIRLHICYCLHTWGLGEKYGVPRIFY